MIVRQFAIALPIERNNMKVLEGQKITSIRTLKSMYDGNCVEVSVPTKKPSGYEYYRLPCETILQMMNNYQFILEKKRVHTHLVEACIKDEGGK